MVGPTRPSQRVITNHSTWAGATIHRVIYCTAVISGADNPVGNREQDVYLRALKRAQVTDRIELGTYVRRVATAPLATPTATVGQSSQTQPGQSWSKTARARTIRRRSSSYQSRSRLQSPAPRRGLTKAAASGPRRQGREAGRLLGAHPARQGGRLNLSPGVRCLTPRDRSHLRPRRRQPAPRQGRQATRRTDHRHR